MNEITIGPPANINAKQLLQWLDMQMDSRRTQIERLQSAVQILGLVRDEVARRVEDEQEEES